MTCDSPINVSRTIRNGGTTSNGDKQVFGRWTFEYQRAREFVEERLDGRVLNACAGKTKLDHDREIVRNDLNPDRDADYHIDVASIATRFDSQSFDTVVFDPPFDQAQAEEHYESMHDRQRGPSRRKLAGLVQPGGVFVECGWNMHSPGEFDGWRREEVHIFRRGPSYQPVFLTADRRESRQSELPGGSDE